MATVPDSSSPGNIGNAILATEPKSNEKNETKQIAIIGNDASKLLANTNNNQKKTKKNNNNNNSPVNNGNSNENNNKSKKRQPNIKPTNLEATPDATPDNTMSAASESDPTELNPEEKPDEEVVDEETKDQPNLADTTANKIGRAHV